MHFQLIHRASPKFKDNVLCVTSLGGGPGTDIFAIMKSAVHMFDTPPSRFKFNVFDGVTKWESTLEELLEDSPHPPPDYTYFNLDLSRSAITPPRVSNELVSPSSVCLSVRKKRFARLRLLQ
jgi:hypothetical protein